MINTVEESYGRFRDGALAGMIVLLSLGEYTLPQRHSIAILWVEIERRVNPVESQRACGLQHSRPGV